MYEVQFEGRKAVKQSDHIKKRLIPMLELKKTPMTATAENITNNSSTVVVPEVSVNDYLTGTEKEINQPRRSSRLMEKPKRTFA